MRAAALGRLLAVVIVGGGGLALVVFALVVAGSQVARAALGPSIDATLAVAVVVGLAGGEAVVAASVVGLRACTTGEDR